MLTKDQQDNGHIWVVDIDSRQDSGRETSGHTEEMSAGPTKDRQAYRQTDKQTDRQTDR
jgi:hypothetical protein